ncbi:MAG: acetylglutamate kinase [Trueperaceae bacterium]
MVIKYGGNAMTDDATRQRAAAALYDATLGGEPPVVVHGGGPFIKAALDAAGLEHRFERGLRVTTPESLEVIESVLTLLGKKLAQEIGPAVGLTGRDAALLHAAQRPELGRVGRMTRVEPRILGALRAAGLVPVVACLALGEDGGLLNVNADEVAGAVAGALGEGVVFLTNVPGVLDDPADPGSLLAELTRSAALDRMADGRIAGGMIPKVEAALAALDQGAPFAVVADGRDAAGVNAALAGGGTRVTAG